MWGLSTGAVIIGRGKLDYSRKVVPQFRSTHHKSHMYCPAVESEPTELRHGRYIVRTREFLQNKQWLKCCSFMFYDVYHRAFGDERNLRTEKWNLLQNKCIPTRHLTAIRFLFRYKCYCQDIYCIHLIWLHIYSCPQNFSIFLKDFFW
jgi:hypothetical protein